MLYFKAGNPAIMLTKRKRRQQTNTSSEVCHHA